MIKKTLLWLWITLLSFICFSNAEDLSYDLPYNFYTQNINNIIDSNLNFENVWQDQISHNRLYLNFNSERKFIFRRNWKIYFFQKINWDNKQWYFTKVCKIYSETWYLNWLFWCNANTPSDYINISEFYDLQNPIFTKIYIVPTAWYNIMWVYDSNSKYFYFFSQEYLDWSINLSYDIIDITNYTTNSPYWSWNYIPWNTSITNNTTCPTIKQLMQSMWKNYNTWLCYNNTNYYNWTTFEQIEKEDIFTIFNDDYENYVNRISIYRNNCNAAATNQNCWNAFSGEFKKFSIISNAINSKVDEKNLRNYCNLGLNFDPNATTCTLNWSWIIKEEYTTEEEIQNIINNWTIPTPNINSWNDSVLNVLTNNWELDRHEFINNRNFIDSLSSIYWKITWLFKERNGVNGIIPEYILRIAFMMILFTVIFKK